MKTVTLFACCLALFQHAKAREAADSSRVVDLDEVVVVAQPKDQVRLRLQPVSSNVLSDRQLRQLNVHDLAQLSQYVPAFTMPAYGSRLTSSIYVRGIGSRINNPAVGVYYDNIPLMSKAAYNSHFYMIDRVDVLRGPQGTLYGQNTEGGLVRIYSKNPMEYQGTDIRAGMGTALWRNVEVAHHHRPSERLAFTAAAFYTGMKGFTDNQNFDHKNDKTNEAGGKLRLTGLPDDNLKLDWTADYQYTDQNGFAYGEYDVANDEVADPATTIMNGYRRNMLTTGLTMSTGVGNHLQTAPLLFTSTTSYQYLDDKMTMDQDYSTPDYLRLQQCQKMSAITQEFVLRSQHSRRWQHTTGLFGAYKYLRTSAPVSFGEAITRPIADAIATAMKNAMLQSMTGRFMSQGMSQGQAQAMAQQTVDRMGVTMTAEMGAPQKFHTPQMNYALFHESSIGLNERLKLTVGLRLNADVARIDYDAQAYMNMTGGTASATTTYHLTSKVADKRQKTFTQLLPKAALTYTLRGNTGNVYALVAKGYRAGGYNIQMFSDILEDDLNAHQQEAMRGDYEVAHTGTDYDAIEETIAYKPEESWNYEAGTHLSLCDSHVQLDLAVYYMQIRNQQLSIMEPNSNYGRMMVNAGKSHSCGIETTLRGCLTGNTLEWAVTYAFTNAKFDDYDTYGNNHVPFMPQHTFSAMADYHIGKLTIGANVSGQGKTWWDEANTYAQQSYALLGAHADYDFGPLTVSLWGRNLTDTHYNTFAIQSSATGQLMHFAQKANPLQAGINVEIHL